MRIPCSRAPWRARVIGTLLLCTLAFVGCGSLDDASAVPEQGTLGESKAPVVYGLDDRKDVYAHADATLKARAQQSTVALLGSSSINTSDPTRVTFNASTLADSYNYSASNTHSAQQNTVNKVVALTAGQTLTVATCGLPGTTFTGDTYLRLYGPLGIQLAFNDDACGGTGSSLSFTTTSGGNFEIRGGCYSSGSCTATTVWQISSSPPTTGGSYTFSASNTNSAQQNTVNQNVSLAAGQTITVSTCDDTTDDTYLRLHGP